MIEVVLPGGFERHGAWQHRVWLRPWSGHDEARLAEAEPTASCAARTTALLASCLTLDGGDTPATPELARQLTVGDREALLLHLRKMTLGERLACVLTCPACGERMDLDLLVSDLLVAPYGRERQSHSVTIADGEDVFRVRFRLPTGADQEVAAALVAGDAEQAVRLVLARCVVDVVAANGHAMEELPLAVARRLPALMAELDPQAELRLEAECPTCGAPFATLFDAAGYVQQEITQASGELFREIHLLAYHYHWSEAEILALTGPRRRRYLGLLAETLPKEHAQ